MPKTRTFWLAIVLLVGAISPVSAARFDTDITGTIVAIQGTMITIQDAQGQRFRAETAKSALDPQGKRHTYRSECLIEVTGKELVKNLTAGMALQIECRLANRRVLVGEVRKLTLITISPATQTGILSAEPVDNEAADSEAKLEDCVVVCQLVKCKNGNLTLALAGEKGNIELFVRRAADDVVEVWGSNLGFVMPGDKIRAQGYTHGLPHFFARDVEIEHVPYVESKTPPVKIEVAKKRPGMKKQEREPFELGDPEAAAKPGGKVRLQVIKVN